MRSYETNREERRILLAEQNKNPFKRRILLAEQNNNPFKRKVVYLLESSSQVAKTRQSKY